MGRQSNNPTFNGTAGGTVAQFTLCKRHTDGTIINSGANEIAIGIATQDQVSGDIMSLRSPTAGGEHKIKAKGDGVNIAIGDILVGGAGGKALKLPAGAGTYYQVGIAQEACTADGDVIAVNPTGWGVKHVVA